jgi:hypothetical protein
MLRIVSLSILASVGALALAAPAEADHRWRRHNTFPLIEVFPGGWDDDEETYYYEDEEEVPRNLRRNLRAEDQWWLYEDEDLEPVVKKPAKKKKVQKKTATVAAKPAKPVPKPVIKPLTATSASAATLSGDDKPKSNIVTQSKIVPAPPVTTATATAKAAPAPAPAAALNTVGCTAGAAVVTGYGFAEVKPKTCTGDTYTYTASRGGKSFLIKITASSGEVVDVKKL